MNSNLSIIFCLSVTWKEVEVSYGACLVEVKRHVQMYSPQFLKEKWNQAAKKRAFPSSLTMSIASSAMPCKPLRQGTVHTLFSS